ncbi:hypothetical protein HMN09_00099500 [Mycena chlorophos]|uniref:WD40 repeat-like protein n=1 Tax=Mycena chlorophos TaxID=658473 RepID=A0A8H6TT18_MYCCL|nr:hypothetical protein HMN09_00099500 [Mycena chlorophos]
MDLARTLTTPAPVSALALGPAGQLLAGSDDGSVRVYDPVSWKVAHAIRGLPADVASIVCTPSGDVWVASGRSAYAFSTASQKLVQTVSDAIASLVLGEDEEDVLNELALSKTHLAFSTDSGTVGVVDLSTNAVSRMKTRHTSICGNVRFIPVRPRELLSAGYDSALLHFDFALGTILSRRDITAPASTDGVSLSPPFILSAAMTGTGAVAAGTADGRLWVSCGGDKSVNSGKKKRSRRWEGLNEEDEILEKIAEGPVVAMSFSGSSTLLVSTLLGTLTQYTISRSASDELQLSKNTEIQVGIAKVNALVCDDQKVAIAGLTADGKGIIEIRTVP